ncbi:MAG: hypothetical protein AB1512_26435 [Thermodesulfobacteriota bacterium]
MSRWESAFTRHVQFATDAMTGDELDGVTAALVGRWFLLGKGETLGGEDGIVVPIQRVSGWPRIFA